MHRNSDLKARKKQQPSVLPLALRKPFQVSSSSASSTARKYVPILLLLFLLHYVLVGRILPAPLVSLISFVASPITFFFSASSSPSSVSMFTDTKFLGTKYQHGLTSNKKVIEEKNKYIFPLIQEAPFLKELGLDTLFKVTQDGSSRKLYSYSPDYFDDLSATNEMTNENAKDKTPEMQSKQTYADAIKHFKENGHRIYTGKEKPEVVLVTAINFEDLDPSYLVKIIQNRVDYAHKNGYAIYSRWVQEFTPIFQEYRSDPEGWAKIFVLREAMYAFPHAKWFWYIGENSLIMRDDIDINKYLLKPKALDPIILRNQPLIPPDGAVKTYSHTVAQDVSLILTQKERNLNTDNFIIKNDLTGRAILELWMDPLFRKYPSFRKDESNALAHLLQWHPVILSKTAIVPPRAIAALAPEKALESRSNEFIYQNGDLIVSLGDCRLSKDCESLLGPYWEKTLVVWTNREKDQEKSDQNAKESLEKKDKTKKIDKIDKIMEVEGNIENKVQNVPNEQLQGDIFN